MTRTSTTYFEHSKEWPLLPESVTGLLACFLTPSLTKQASFVALAGLELMESCVTPIPGGSPLPAPYSWLHFKQICFLLTLKYTLRGLERWLSG